MSDDKRPWQPITKDKPAPGEAVLTKIHDEAGPRNEAALKRGASGKLWFFADGTMYVYYEPTHYLPNLQEGVPK